MSASPPSERSDVLAPGSVAAPPLAHVIARVALHNLPFVIALTVMRDLPELARTLITGAILFFVPGLAWVDRREGDGFVVVFRMVIYSLLAALASWLLMYVLPGPTNRAGFLVLLAALTNLGLWLGLRKGWYATTPFGTPLFRMLALVATLFFVQSYVGAAHRIPALEDQDMETQGTSYGLIHALSPTMATDRGTRHFFAHPLLLHFYVAESVWVAGDLDELKHYHDGSLSIAAADDRPLDEVAWGMMIQQQRKDLAIFETGAVLVPTRLPNVFLGVLVVFPLGFLIYRLTASALIATAICALYATLPEVYVRSAYGGYLGLTNFVTLSLGYFYLQGAGLLPDRAYASGAPPNPARRAFGIGALGAWTDQKVALIPGAAVAHLGLRMLADGGFSKLWSRIRSNQTVTIVFLIGLGFVVGWGAYVVYGLLVAPRDFILDHIKNHIVRRLRMNDVNLAQDRHGQFVYLSIVGLWGQFAKHTGWLIVIPAAIAMIRGAKRILHAEGFFFIWAAVGAVGYSMTDWRQTKHLALLLPAMFVLIGMLWASLPNKPKAALSAVLGGALLWNLWMVANVMNEFTYITPLPIW